MYAFSGPDEGGHALDREEGQLVLAVVRMYRGP
jgi:hypothetical protein